MTCKECNEREYKTVSQITGVLYAILVPYRASVYYKDNTIIISAPMRRWVDEDHHKVTEQYPKDDIRRQLLNLIDKQCNNVKPGPDVKWIFQGFDTTHPWNAHVLEHFLIDVPVENVNIEPDCVISIKH